MNAYAGKWPEEWTSINELWKHYHTYSLNIRLVSSETADRERLYLGRLAEYFGSPDRSATLFFQLTPNTIIAFLKHYAENHNKGSRNWMQKTLRQFLKFSFNREYIQSDLSFLSPSVYVPQKGKVMKGIPDDCLKTVLTSMSGDSPADLFDAALFSLLSTYGVRGIQIRQLRLQDVDWNNDRIHFPAAKRGRPIEQFLTPHVGNCLMDYLLKGRPESCKQELFLTLKKPHEPLLKSSELSFIIRKRFERAGVKLPEGVSYGSHGFRHRFASKLYGQIPFKDLVDMLGHRKPSTTLIYAKGSVQTLRKAALEWPGGDV